MKKQTKEFMDMLYMSQEELYIYVMLEVTKIPNVMVNNEEGAYIWVKTSPTPNNKPLLTSHLDTVDSHLHTYDTQLDIVDGRVVSLSNGVVGGDDRAGVWIMLQLLRKGITDYDYVFCCDEEVGGFGSDAFATSNNEELLELYSCFISLDRQGSTDVALYGYDNTDLVKVFTDIGYIPASGSFTDCCNMSQVTKLACVNLSVGYYNEHTASEVQDITIMYNVLNKLSRLDVIDALHSKGQYLATNNYDYEFDDYYGYDDVPTEDTHVVCDCCSEHKKLYKYIAPNNDYNLCYECYGFYEENGI